MRMFEDSTKVVQAISYDGGDELKGPPIIFMELLEGGNMKGAFRKWMKVIIPCKPR